MTAIGKRFVSGWADTAGKAVSTVCAVHCLSCALAPGLLVLVGLERLLHPAVEWTLLGGALVLGVLGAMTGFHRHRRVSLLAAFVVAGVFLVGGRILEVTGGSELAWAIGVTGGLTLAATHIWNLRACSKCELGRPG